jgi:hypothetical protein
LSRRARPFNYSEDNRIVEQVKKEPSMGLSGTGSYQFVDGGMLASFCDVA